MHLFLQVFDEGLLKDNHHHKISFKDTIIIMTSNVMSNSQSIVGFKKAMMSKNTLKESFSQEFLNRIDEVIHYQPLKKKDLKDILIQNSPIELSQKMINDILEDYDSSIGARALLAKMKKYIVSKNR